MFGGILGVSCNLNWWSGLDFIKAVECGDMRMCFVTVAMDICMVFQRVAEFMYLAVCRNLQGSHRSLWSTIRMWLPPPISALILRMPRYVYPRHGAGIYHNNKYYCRNQNRMLLLVFSNGLWKPFKILHNSLDKDIYRLPFFSPDILFSNSSLAPTHKIIIVIVLFIYNMICMMCF